MTPTRMLGGGHERSGMKYFEDFRVGEVYVFGPVTVQEDDIIAFARRYDPQPMHLDF